MILRRAAAVVGLIAAMLPLGSGVAAAHGSGIGPDEHLPRIVAVDPPVAGLDVTVIEAGGRLRLDNRTGTAVEVVPPAGAARTVEPLVGPGGTARWTDPRVVAAAVDPVPLDGHRAWEVVLRAGEQTVTVRGEQVWPSPPPTGLWWLVTLITAAVVAVIGTLVVTRRRGAPALASVTLLVAGAHVVHVLGSALVVEERSLAAVAVGAAGPAALAWVLAVAGAGLTLAHRGYGPLLCAVGRGSRAGHRVRGRYVFQRGAAVRVGRRPGPRHGGAHPRRWDRPVRDRLRGPACADAERPGKRIVSTYTVAVR